MTLADMIRQWMKDQPILYNMDLLSEILKRAEQIEIQRAKVFVVSSGTYSDYSIEALFTTREKAQDYMTFVSSHQKYPLEFNEIEEFELDVPSAEWILTYVRINRDFEIIETYDAVSDGATRAGFVCFDDNSNLVWAVATTDKERAIKVASEKATEILAQNLWGEQTLGKVSI